MSDGKPRPLLCYSRRRRADDDDDDLGASPGDRAVRPRANPDAADAAMEAPPSGGTPRRPRASPRAPPPVAHAPDDSASTSRRGLVTLSRLGAESAPAPAPPQPGAAHAPPRPGAAPPQPRPALGAWSIPLRQPSLPQDPQAPGAGPSTTGPLQPAGASHRRPPSIVSPAAPVTPVAIIPRAAQRGTSARPGVGTVKVHNDNTPRDVFTWNGIRQSAYLPVSCIHGDTPARGMDEIRVALINSLSHSYVEAIRKLPMDDMPELLSCVINAGHAYGILEPINNIIVNAINYRHSLGKYSGRIDASVHDPRYWTRSAEKSLQGLVVFLRSYFWCLSEEQALGYLYLSNADLALAVGLVERDQNVGCSFHQVSTRTQVAMTLAAHAATHPKPRSVGTKMTGCFRSASIDTLRMWLRQTKISKIAVLEVYKLFEGYAKGYDYKDGKTLYSLRTVCYDPFDIVQLKTKQRRQECVSLGASECSYIKMLKLLILDGNLKEFHMDAISKLSSEVVSRLHRGLVVAGQSCGFFDLPARNIIVNAIWYTWAFPQEEDDDTQEADTPVSLLCSERMSRVSQQSLDGSIAFLQARYRKSCMSKHEAIEFFYGAKCILADADKLANSSGHTVSCSDQTALEAAVNAMGYMWQDGALCLVHALYSGLGAEIRSYLLNVEGEISVADVNSLTNMLSQRLAPPLTSLPRLVSRLSAPAKAILAEGKNKFLRRQSFLENKVKDLLKSNVATAELRLHSICGAPGHFSKSSKFYHVNFWAVKKGIHNDMDLKTRCLFFAEIWATPRDDHESSLHKLTSGVKGRCFSCELYQNKVWHPTNAIYEGLDEEAFATFLDPIWTKAQKAKRNMDSDCFYFNCRTDTILAERLIEARESESECFECI